MNSDLFLSVSRTGTTLIAQQLYRKIESVLNRIYVTMHPTVKEVVLLPWAPSEGKAVDYVFS